MPTTPPPRRTNACKASRRDPWNHSDSGFFGSVLLLRKMMASKFFRPSVLKTSGSALWTTVSFSRVPSAAIAAAPGSIEAWR